MSDIVVSATGLWKSYGETVALAGVDLTVRRGEIVTIVGPSGSGKSTLLRCLNALEVPDSGQVTVAGQPVRAGAPGIDAARRRVAMVFQAFHLFPHLSVLDNLVLAPVLVGAESRRDAEQHARELLARVGLADREAARPGQLSGGQQQRVAIARALAMRPDALLCDEPTSALDPETVGEVLQVLREIAATGTTMCVVTHELAFAAEVSTRTLFMDAGEVVEEGPTANLLSAPRSARLRAFLSRVRPA